MTTIKLFGGDLGNEIMLVRCDLTQASSPMQVDYCNEHGRKPSGWESTQYQCADCRHRTSGMADYAKIIAAQAVEMSAEDFDCEWEEIATVYVIRDAGGEYLGADGDWTPASDEAQEYETREEADEACEECDRNTAKVLSRDAQVA